MSAQLFIPLVHGCILHGTKDLTNCRARSRFTTQTTSGMQELQRLQRLAWKQMSPTTAFDKPADKDANTGASLAWVPYFAVSVAPEYA